MNDTAIPIHTHTYNGLPVQTGDILCTHDGIPGSLFGRLWGLMGLLTPGEVDHIVIYVGPGGRCIESALHGVRDFEMPGDTWDPGLLKQRRSIVDQLVGVAYPLQALGLDSDSERFIRTQVAAFCLEKAGLQNPYNLNFFKPEVDGAYYCSQLAYKAYLSQGIDLNTNVGMPGGKLLDRVIFPMEIWNGLPHRRAA